jgi:hypothetical protein
MTEEKLPISTRDIWANLESSPISVYSGDSSISFSGNHTVLIRIEFAYKDDSWMKTECEMTKEEFINLLSDKLVVKMERPYRPK